MQRQAKKLIIGITGGFGSGKSTVAKIFKGWGAQVIDADKIAHQLLKPKTKSYSKIIAAFGRGILKQDKTIARNKLAQIVFPNKNLRIKLNQITHPTIIRRIKNKINTSKEKLIVLDAPLLVEAGLRKSIDRLIVVKIRRKVQIERLLKKTSLTESDILRRIKSQIPLENKVRLADFVIDNSGTIQETSKQVKNIWKKMDLSLAAKK